MSWPWPFDREYMQLALAAGLAVGCSAPLIGTFLVQKRLSLMGDGLGHVAFAGVAAGLLLGVEPLWTALIAAVGAAVAIEWLRLRRHASGDLALTLFFYSGIAGGVVLAGLDHSLNATVLSYLFGSILTVSRGDTVVIVVLGVAIVGVVAWLWRALFAVVLDEDVARVSGLPVDALNLALSALTALTVVAAMRVVGVLLVAALMVLPVGTAQQVAHSFRTTLLVAVGVGAGAVIAGLTVARAFGLAPGGTIVLMTVAPYLVSALVTRRSVTARTLRA